MGPSRAHFCNDEITVTYKALLRAQGPSVFCSMMKLLLHNSVAAMTAAALDATQTAAHTVVFSTQLAMFCFVVGDVGTSLALAYLPRFVGDGEGRRPLDTKGGPADRAAGPEGGLVPLGGLCLSFDARGVAWFAPHVGPGRAAAPSRGACR